MKPILDWLVSIGGSPVDVLLMGIIIAGFVMQWNQKRMRNAEIKELFHKYTQLNNLVGKYGVAIQCKLGIQLVAEHYTGEYSMTEPLLDNMDKIPEAAKNEVNADTQKALIETYRRIVAKYDAENIHKHIGQGPANAQKLPEE